MSIAGHCEERLRILEQPVPSFPLSSSPSPVEKTSKPTAPSKLLGCQGIPHSQCTDCAPQPPKEPPPALITQEKNKPTPSPINGLDENDSNNINRRKSFGGQFSKPTEASAKKQQKPIASTPQKTSLSRSSPFKVFASPP